MHKSRLMKPAPKNEPSVNGARKFLADKVVTKISYANKLRKQASPTRYADKFDQYARQISKMMLIDIRLAASMIIDV